MAKSCGTVLSHSIEQIWFSSKNQVVPGFRSKQFVDPVHSWMESRVPCAPAEKKAWNVPIRKVVSGPTMTVDKHQCLLVRYLIEDVGESE